MSFESNLVEIQGINREKLDFWDFKIMDELDLIEENILDEYDDFIKLRNAIETVAFNKRDDGEELFSTMKDEYYCFYAYQTIICASKTRPFSWEYLKKLWISMKFKPCVSIFKDNIDIPFLSYLYHSGVFNGYKAENDSKLNEYNDQQQVKIDFTTIKNSFFRNQSPDPSQGILIEKNHPIGSIEYIIKYDDVNSLQTESAKPNFSFQKRVSHSQSGKKTDLICLAAYYGALNCFKYLVMNNCIQPYLSEKPQTDYPVEKLLSCAIKSGDYGILHILQQHGFSFSSMMKHAVKYHRIDIENWIITNYGFESVSLTTCYMTCNTLSFFFYFKHDLMVDQKSRIGGYPLTVLACQRNDIDFVDFLVENGANIEIADNSHITPLMCCAERGYCNIIYYLLEHGANIEAMDCFSKTALIRAAFAGMNEAIAILVENGANIEAKDSTVSFPILYYITIFICFLMV